MRELFRRLKQCMSDGEDVVLVTIIAHSGSTPRGAGSRMLVNRHGRIHGTIGGGAVEYLAQSMAGEALREKKSCVKGFNLTPNQVEDVGMICGGKVNVHFQYIAATDPGIMPFIDRVLRLFDRDEDAWLITEIGDESTARMALYSKSEGLSGLGLGPEDLERLLACRSKGIEAGSKRYYAEPIVLAGRVIIFGGGHIAQELVPVIAHVGFRCVVIDDRPEFASPELFPMAERAIVGDFSRIADSVSITENDYVVVVTRGHNHDYAVQEQVLRGRFAYIGVVGSRAKIAQTSARLREAGIPQDVIDIIHTPIGTAIKAETPAELAISIAGELIMVRAERRGR